MEFLIKEKVYRLIAESKEKNKGMCAWGFGKVRLLQTKRIDSSNLPTTSTGWKNRNSKSHMIRVYKQSPRASYLTRQRHSRSAGRAAFETGLGKWASKIEFGFLCVLSFVLTTTEMRSLSIAAT
jgi:hypothetical protein